ncbi:hypothetical protein HNQ77_002646 [Silvibacterium bohemicum]|uniref:Uncharacterized protein n=1 Tax=Silvibacterium bohemicum TaxID=1577686 RepID=A0A841JU58_9BACT|nr:hypothetical protein [Silvibacterium bohemicum]MBB6144690.1 hypothetical protein [Silvibacterium bohemicum]
MVSQTGLTSTARVALIGSLASLKQKLGNLDRFAAWCMSKIGFRRLLVYAFHLMMNGAAVAQKLLRSVDGVSHTKTPYAGGEHLPALLRNSPAEGKVGTLSTV